MHVFEAPDYPFLESRNPSRQIHCEAVELFLEFACQCLVLELV